MTSVWPTQWDSVPAIRLVVLMVCVARDQPVPKKTFCCWFNQVFSQKSLLRIVTLVCRAFISKWALQVRVSTLLIAFQQIPNYLQLEMIYHPSVLHTRAVNFVYECNPLERALHVRADHNPYVIARILMQSSCPYCVGGGCTRQLPCSFYGLNVCSHTVCAFPMRSASTLGHRSR